MNDHRSHSVGGPAIGDAVSGSDERRLNSVHRRDETPFVGWPGRCWLGLSTGLRCARFQCRTLVVWSYVCSMVMVSLVRIRWVGHPRSAVCVARPRWRLLFPRLYRPTGLVSGSPCDRPPRRRRPHRHRKPGPVMRLPPPHVHPGRLGLPHDRCSAALAATGWLDPDRIPRRNTAHHPNLEFRTVPPSGSHEPTPVDL
jgi:hypothetical protein